MSLTVAASPPAETYVQFSFTVSNPKSRMASVKALNVFPLFQDCSHARPGFITLLWHNGNHTAIFSQRSVHLDVNLHLGCKESFTCPIFSSNKGCKFKFFVIIRRYLDWFIVQSNDCSASETSKHWELIGVQSDSMSACCFVWPTVQHTNMSSLWYIQKRKAEEKREYLVFLLNQ